MHAPVQEVGKKIDEQQLESIQGAAMPVNIETHQHTVPVIRNAATSHPVRLAAPPPFAMPINLDTGLLSVPVIRDAATGAPMIPTPRIPIRYVESHR
jgi:hypothetical protein